MGCWLLFGYIFYIRAHTNADIWLFVPLIVRDIQSRQSNLSRDCFSPSKLKKWAIDDYHKTLSWLESQEEKVTHVLFCFMQCIDLILQAQSNPIEFNGNLESSLNPLVDF